MYTDVITHQETRSLESIYKGSDMAAHCVDPSIDLPHLKMKQNRPEAMKTRVSCHYKNET